MKKESRPNYTGETRKIHVNDGSRTRVVKAGKDITPPEPKASAGKPAAAEAPAAKEGDK